MEASLLSRYCPRLFLDTAETAPPVDARRYVIEGRLLDADTQQPAGSLQSSLSNSDTYISLPAASPSIVVRGQPLEVQTDGVPLFGKVDTLHLDGAYLHSILYVMCFPPSQSDVLCAHYVKVFVSAATGAVTAAAFGIEGDLPHVWVDAADLRFADRARERVGVYISKDDHTPLPAPGKLWRAGLKRTTPSADGKGQSWQEEPCVLPWPNKLMQYLGRLGPDALAKNPTQRSWWDGPTTQKIAMGARFMCT